MMCRSIISGLREGPTIKLPTETPVISAFAPLTPAANPTKRFRPNWLRWILAVLLVLALVVGIVLWRTHSQNSVIYETATVERGSI